ncbi:MAG TPA: TetR/AcrR family transcriptional regulator [Geopsychrobacteraceae bacterium]
MSGVRAQKKRETRRAIIAAAIRLFGERGYERTSIEDLAAEAGVGKGTIYGYFSTKQEIFQAFCGEEIENSFRAVSETVDPEAPLLRQLLTLFMLQFRFVTKNREFGRHLLREMAFPKTANRKSLEYIQRYLDTLEELLHRAGAKGQLRREANPASAAASFYLLYVGCLSGWYSGYMKDQQSVEDAMEKLFQQALEGIGS